MCRGLFPRLWPGLLVFFLIAGCKSEMKLNSVKGRVHQGGKPLEIAKPVGMVRVVFIPLDEELKKTLGPIEAKVDADGNFTILPNKKRSRNAGLPTGKYKVCIYQHKMSPMQDELKGKFDEANTPFKRDIKEGDNTIELDLSKPN